MDYVLFEESSVSERLIPTSHYRSHLDKSIECVEQKLKAITCPKYLILTAFKELLVQYPDLEVFGLDPVKLASCYVEESEDIEACEALFRLAVAIFLEASKKEFSGFTQCDEFVIDMVKIALKKSQCEEKDQTAKRCAFFLSEVYSNSRIDKKVDQSLVDLKLAIEYLELAKRHGSSTAAEHLKEEDPIMSLKLANADVEEGQPDVLLASDYNCSLFGDGFKGLTEEASDTKNPSPVFGK